MAGWIGRRPRLSLGLALVAGFAVSLALKFMPVEDRKVERTPVVASVLDDPGSPRSGAVQPEVVVVVFTDYQCGICKLTEPALWRLLAADPGVQVVWKDWPIRGALSEFAAQVALAAHRQDRYAAVHNALMASRGTLSRERVLEIAVQAGADPARLAADLGRHQTEIERQLGGHNLQAFGLGLEGTPGYLVGPFLIQGGLDDRALQQAVAKARRAGPPR
jgi:protein-disulfide isomerase